MTLFRASLLTAIVTLLLFLNSAGNDFVALDDFAYIINNNQIKTLNLGTLWWAFTSFHEGNWHPLTMLSLAFDRWLWGLNPFGFHLTSILIHSCTVFCSCYVFAYLLEAASRDNQDDDFPPVSGQMLIAAASLGSLFFGIHPLRVESVAWASERKDVLCLFFLITSIWCYLRYAVQRTNNFPSHYLSSKAYCFSLLLAGCAQMSKPTAVSLPFILLIIDWYPLNRLTDRLSIKRSLHEKIPFLLIAALGVLSTLAAQQIAIDSAPKIELASRLLVACKAFLFYLVKTVWPSNLMAFYMHPGNVAESKLSEYLLYLFLVVLLCLLLFFAGRKRRLWPALGLYYGVTLAPMVGLVQVGGQWAADRYSYLPALGLSLLWGWGWVWIALRLRIAGQTLATYVCILSVVLQLIAYSMLTVDQISVWKDTESLATRIIELSPQPSGAAYHARALYRYEVGKYELAHADVTEAMKIALRGNLKGTYPELAMTQTRILDALGRYHEALAAADWAMETSDIPLPSEFLSLRHEIMRKAVSAVSKSGSGKGGR